MKKKKVFPDDNMMNPLDDTNLYGAGHEADEILNTDDDIDVHANGGIPDETGEDIGDDDDEDDDDDERA